MIKCKIRSDIPINVNASAAAERTLGLTDESAMRYRQFLGIMAVVTDAGVSVGPAKDPDDRTEFAQRFERAVTNKNISPSDGIAFFEVDFEYADPRSDMRALIRWANMIETTVMDWCVKNHRIALMVPHLQYHSPDGIYHPHMIVMYERKQGAVDEMKAPLIEAVKRHSYNLRRAEEWKNRAREIIRHKGLISQK